MAAGLILTGSMGRDVPCAIPVSGVGSNNERGSNDLSKYSRRLAAVSTPLTPSSDAGI